MVMNVDTTIDGYNNYYGSLEFQRDLMGYFKISHGKRIFRMAPIHHHFEKGGWSEVRVVAVFTVVTVILCAVSLLGIW